MLWSSLATLRRKTENQIQQTGTPRHLVTHGPTYRLSESMNYRIAADFAARQLADSHDDREAAEGSLNGSQPRRRAKWRGELKSFTSRLPGCIFRRCLAHGAEALRAARVQPGEFP